LVAPATDVHRHADSVVADAAAKVEPAIVDVHTEGKAVALYNPGFDDPMFRQFFGGPDGQNGGGQQQYVPKGAGSGVIISSDGYILTNDHVVANTTKVTVKVNDKGYDAKVIGTDPVSDIAVVKIDAPGVKLPVAKLGNSDDLRVGDWAIAVGNPLDVGTTVTLGIVSALHRTGMQAEDHPMGSVIQTDAAINPGNSGGALANIDGEVIGINEAIASPTGASVGIGFAIPINTARTIAMQLIRDGKIVRPYLGVAYKPLKAFPAEARRDMGISVSGDNGVVVEQVVPDSPADQAGLQVYDVILEANRQKINDADQLKDLVSKLKIGDTITLLVSRSGQNQIVTATLKERPANADSTVPHQRQQQMQPMLPMP